MMGTCAYPGCGRGFERKRSDARYCSDTCRAKASKDRARARREGAGRRASRQRGAVVAPGPGDAGALAERLVAMEQRLAAAEAGVARAEADRAGWKKVRDQLQAALGRVEGGGPVSAEKVAAAVRAEVAPHLAKLGKRLDAVEAEQAAVRGEMAKLTAPRPAPDEDGLMTLAKGIGKLTTRVSTIERDLRALNKGIVEAIDDAE